MRISLDQLPYDPDKLFDEPLVELTQSALAMFQTCRQKYVLRYLMGIKPRGIKVPLLVGSAIHLGLEMLLDPKSKLKTVKRMPAIRKEMHALIDDRLSKSDIVSPNDLDKIEQGRAQALAIIETWPIIHGDDFERWKMVGTEMTFRAAEGATKDSALLDRMAGKIDGVILDEDMRCWLLESKSRLALDGKFGINILSLELDHQALWYAMLNNEVLPHRKPSSKSSPRHAHGFMYNAMKKPQHKLNEKGFDELVERMKKAILEDPEKYFSLQPLEIKDETLERVKANFKRVIAMMDSLAPATVTMNTAMCDNYSGCEYKPLCQNGADASMPRSVLVMPQMEAFEVRLGHDELEEEV